MPHFPKAIMKTTSFRITRWPAWNLLCRSLLTLGVAVSANTASAALIDFEDIPVGTRIDPWSDAEVTLRAFSWFSGYSDYGFDDRYYFTEDASGRVYEYGGNRWLVISDASPYDGIGARHIEISAQFRRQVERFTAWLTSSEGASLVYTGVSDAGPFSGSVSIPWDREWVPVDISAPAGGHLTGFSMVIHDGYSPRGTVGSMELDNLYVLSVPEGGPGLLGVVVLLALTPVSSLLRGRSGTPLEV